MKPRERTDEGPQNTGRRGPGAGDRARREAGSVTLIVVSPALTVVGVGLLTTPVVLSWARPYAHLRRVWGHGLAGVRIPAAYRPFPAGLTYGPVGQARRCAVLLRDPATWRELLWLPVDATAGMLPALLPPSLAAYGVGFLLLPNGICGCWRCRPTWTAADRPLACPAHGTVVSTEHWGHT
ncbi:sensor domain-containing protein [Streptomyces nigrescens]